MSVAAEAPASTESQATETEPSLDSIISESADSVLNGPPEESIESTLDAPAEDPVEEAPEATSEQGDWDDSLLSLAEKYDISRDSAKLYGSPEMLRRAMLDIDRSAAKWGKQFYESQQQEQPAQQATQQPAQQVQQAPAQQAQQQAQPGRYTWEKYKVPLGEDYDPDAVKTFNEINDHWDNVVKGLQAQHEQYITALAEHVYGLQEQMQQYTGHHVAEGEAQLVRDVDTFVSSLGDEYADVYGKTPTNRLAQNSPLLAERQKLVTEMQHLKAAYGDRFSDVELLEKANAILHSDKQQQLVRKQIQGKVKAQQDTQIHRATGNQPRAKTGYERAVAKVAELLPAMYGDDNESLDEFTGF